jgi:Ca2+-binding EF-hand superfamily protein
LKFSILLAVIFSTSVFAQGANMVGAPGSNPRASLNERINQLDLNHDGFISKAEAVSYPKLSKGFKRLDKNKDSVLSSDELAAFSDTTRARRAAKAPKVKKTKAASN